MDVSLEQFLFKVHKFFSIDDLNSKIYKSMEVLKQEEIEVINGVLLSFLLFFALSLSTVIFWLTLHSRF